MEIKICYKIFIFLLILFLLYTFEGIKLYGVERADDYLKFLYGDYMQLPPENKRHIHIEHLYLKIKA